MRKYINQRNKRYYYRRRVPAALSKYFNTPYINKALSNNRIVANANASSITMQIDNAIVMVSLGLQPNLQGLVEQEVVPTTFREISKQFLNVSTSSTARLNKTPIQPINAISTSN